MIELIIYFCASVMLSLLIFRVFLTKNKYVGIYDIPNKRKIHDEKILKIGGIGVLFVFLLLLSIFRLVNQEFLFIMNKIEGQVFLATVFLIIGGLIDDIVGMNAPKKLFFQIISISIIINAGFYISLSSNYLVNIVLSFAFFVLVINSMNLIDGIDGLSSGIFILFVFSVITLCLYLSIIDSKYYILIAIFMGSILGFFITNFPPAKLFLGDVGSMLLGWISAVSIVYLSLYFDDNFKKVCLISLLSLPFYDVFFVALKRYQSSNKSFLHRISSIVYPDKNHIHHLLLNNGYSIKKSLSILLSFYAFCLLITMIAFFINSMYLVSFLLVLILNIIFRKYFEHKTNIMEPKA